MSEMEQAYNFDAMLFDFKTLKAYLNCGRPMAEKVAKEAGAVQKFGHSIKYYRPAIDKYLASRYQNQN